MASTKKAQAPEDSFIRISEILQEFRDLIAEHVINGLNHLGLQLFKFIDVVATQDLLEMINTGKIACR